MRFNLTTVAPALLLASALLPGPALAQRAPSPERFSAAADAFVAAYNAGDYGAMQRGFGNAMRAAFPLAKARPFFEGLKAQHGEIEKLGKPRLTPPAQAVFPAHFERVTLDLKIVLDRAGKIDGLWLLPHRPVSAGSAEQSTPLRLPFEGAWHVFWGGDTREQNHHHDVPPQRYALDLIIVDRRGVSHRGNGRKNDDFFAFGKRVLAPADGVVTEVIDGVPDNLPGSMNPYSALGNAVTIEHPGGEYSVIAHFKQGSIRVRPKQKVVRGQIIGLCGNSGNSSEPHIHFHVQDGPVIQDAQGLKVRFDDVVLLRGGKKETLGHHAPVKGEVVEHGGPK